MLTFLVRRNRADEDYDEVYIDSTPRLWRPVSRSTDLDDEYFDDDFLDKPQLIDAPTIPIWLSNKEKLWRAVTGLQNSQYWLNFLEDLDGLTEQDAQELQAVLDKDQIIVTLCDLLKTPLNNPSSMVLLALYITINTYLSIPSSLKSQVKESLKILLEHTDICTTEHRLLILNISKLLEDQASQHETPEAIVDALRMLKEEDQLTSLDVKRILAASTDIRKITYVNENYSNLTTVQSVAWNTLKQQFNLSTEALDIVLEGLNNKSSIICATSARLLQNNRHFHQSYSTMQSKKL